MATSPGFGLKLVTPPTWQPVQVQEALDHARVLATDANASQMQGLLMAAQDYVETGTSRKVAQQQWLLTCDEFPGRQVDDYRPPTWRYGIFRLPFSPLISVDQVQYIDPGVTGGQPFPLTTLDPSMWMYDANTEPGRLAPSPYNVWPATNPLAVQAVQITFTCGYASVQLVPPGILLAIKLLTAFYWDHRSEAEDARNEHIPFGVRALIAANGTQEYD